MESDPFSRSLFLNKFWRGILWKIDNESESEKKKKKKEQSLTRNFAKKSVSILINPISDQIQK